MSSKLHSSRDRTHFGGDSAPIVTIGDLRNFLASAMTDVRDGSLEIGKASQIAKLAGRINDLICTEIKVARAKKDSYVKEGTFGDLKIAQPKAA